MKLSLSIKIALSSLVVTLSGVVAMAWISYDFSDRVLQEKALQTLAQTVDREMSILEGKLSTIKEDTHFLAESLPIKGLNRALSNEGFDDQENMTREMWQLRIESLFETVLKQRAMYDQIRLIGVDDHGRELVRVERSTGGIQVIAAHQLQQKGDRNYFQRSIHLNPGQLYFSKITLNREHGAITFPPRAMLRVITPIFGQNHKVFALLTINISARKLIPVVSSKQDDNSLFFVTNERGDYLIHPDRSREMAFEYGKSRRLLDDYPELAPIWKQMVPDNDHSADTLLLRRKNIGISLFHLHFDPRYPERFLTLGSVETLAKLSATSLDLRNRLLLILLALTLVLTLITLLLIRRITKPIQELTVAINEIGKGDRSVEIPVSGHDEITMLGAAFGDMLTHLDASKKALQDSNVILETKVSQRTYELEVLNRRLDTQNSELTEALKQAKQAAKAKGMFLATMSHEIRTPLNGVLGLTELVLDSELTQEQRDRLQAVQTSGETLLTILNDILDLSKMESSQFTLSQSEFSPNDLVEHITKLYSQDIQQKNIGIISATIPTLSHYLLGDPDRLRQVLMNLLSNAIKFTDSGEVILKLDLLHEDPEQMTLRFAVSDSGIGISQENQYKLFDSFSQVDATHTRKYGGTGLGLSIARRLIRLMDSELLVESKEGVGSRFWFDITLKKGSPLIDTAISHAESFGQWRVLIVDDNKNNRDILQQILESWGAHTLAVEGGKEALQQLMAASADGFPYHLALIDQMMPEMDGIALTQQIKQTSPLAPLKIIMLSSSNDEHDCSLTNEHGLDGCLRKPIDQASLLHLILSIMGVPSASTPSIEQPAPIRSEKILLAEDVAVNQQVAIGMLNKIGLVNIDIANNGTEAVELFDCEKYALILMDLQMPGMDGYSAAQKIRAVEHAQQHATRTPIIAVTAHAFADEKRKSIEMGMDDLVTKPLTGEKLTEVIHHWLSIAAPPAAPKEASLDNTDTDDTVAAVDSKVLRHLHRDMGSGIGAIITMYVDALPEQIEAICQALQDQNGAQLQHLAHRMKGTSRNIGALTLADLCEALESQVDDMEAINSEQVVQSLHDEKERVLQALSANWLDEIR